MKNNVSNIVLLVLLAGIIAFFSISYIIVDEKNFSEDENRYLQTSPRFTLEKLLDGTYTRQLHDYYSDQINLRNIMVEFKALTELAMGKNENNGVLLGGKGYLIETDLYTDKEIAYLNANLKRIDKLIANLEENGINSSFTLVPRKVDVLSDKLPSYYSSERNELAWDLASKHQSIDILTLLKEENQKGNEVFYKTDHHWSAFGAYVTYNALGEHLGYAPHTLEHFNLQTISNQFYGTTYSTSGFFFVGADTILSPDIENGKYTTTIVDINTSFEGLYDTSYLSKKDKYSVFLSGNNAHVKIYDNNDLTKETLVIIKDSFSHSLVPYLCEHYNIELIDPRYYAGSIESYIIENNIEHVLFLFGIDTLAQANISIR